LFTGEFCGGNSDDFVLCGHSYGGMVVAGVADRIPGRLRSLVFLDASVPKGPA
jgi:pimeloyl-ACP methyl ester carboxylesterase